MPANQPLPHSQGTHHCTHTCADTLESIVQFSVCSGVIPPHTHLERMLPAVSSEAYAGHSMSSGVGQGQDEGTQCRH